MCLRNRDLQVASDCFKVLRCHPSVHDSVADWANAGKVSNAEREWKVVGEVSRWTPGLAASDAVEVAWWTGTLGFLAPFTQEIGQIKSENEDGPPIVNARQAICQPIADRVLVNTEQIGGLLHAIAAVDFDTPPIGAARHATTQSNGLVGLARCC